AAADPFAFLFGLDREVASAGLGDRTAEKDEAADRALLRDERDREAAERVSDDHDGRVDIGERLDDGGRVLRRTRRDVVRGEIDRDGAMTESSKRGAEEVEAPGPVLAAVHECEDGQLGVPGLLGGA